jgi:hypothetical protein
MIKKKTRGSLQPSLGGPDNSIPIQLPSPPLHYPSLHYPPLHSRFFGKITSFEMVTDGFITLEVQTFLVLSFCFYQIILSCNKK